MKLSIISSAKHLRKQRCHYTRDFSTWFLEIISLKALSNIQARQLSIVTFRFGYSLMNNLKKRRTIMSSWHLHEAILALKLKKKNPCCCERSKAVNCQIPLFVVWWKPNVRSYSRSRSPLAPHPHSIFFKMFILAIFLKVLWPRLLQFFASINSRLVCFREFYLYYDLLICERGEKTGNVDTCYQ